MNGEERVVKHLEIIQGVINRLAHNSFLIKGWSVAILAAAVIFISRAIAADTIQYSLIILVCVIPVIIGFWILDGYFLWQERLFRGVYNDVRKQEKTDFGMNIPKQMSKPGCKWRDAFFSVTLKIFYLIEVFYIFSVYIIVSLILKH